MIYIDVNVFIKNLNIPKFKNLQNAHSKNDIKYLTFHDKYL